MSDLLNSASLVMIPSGYKEDIVYSQIPLDGSGDLQLTRASNGTRINSAGLVEVCPWNLLEQSETFDNATWSKSGIAVTANASANPLTGLVNADNLIADTGNNFHYIYQPITYTSDQYTIFVYLKANGYSWFVIDAGLSNCYAYFNTSTGVVGTTGSSATSIIESVGNGWYKCSLSFTAIAGSAGIYLSVRNADNGGSFTGNGTGGILAYGAQLNIGSTAKPYFPTTDRLNVPRLTYQNGGGGCPSLLLEKQSTNLTLWSEDFTQWTASNATVTANNTTSPDGTQNADRIQFTGAGYLLGASQGAGTVYTISCYAKRNGSGTQSIGFFKDGSGTVDSAWALTSDWQRFTYTYTASNGSYSGIAGVNGGDVFVWGAQLEASSYPTSYIGPTTSSSATRVADECAKSGIGALIGGTSGTVFFDIKTNPVLSSANYKQFCYYLDSASAQSYMYLNNSNQIVTNSNWGSLSYATAFQPNTRYKVALVYAPNDFALYINGVSVATASSGTPKDNVNISIGQLSGTENCEFVFNEYIHFKSRLTNAELASLTTI